MNTIVWVMVMYSYGGNVSAGLEFKTQEKCEQAAKVIAQSAPDRFLIGKVSTPWCVRIEK